MKVFDCKLDRFIAKRAAAYLIVLSAVGIAVFGQNKWLALAGLLAGTALSVARVRLHTRVYKRILGTGLAGGGNIKSGAIAALTANQLILPPALLLAYFVSRWFFTAFVAGLLSAPAVIMINSVTEAFGITKNSFE